MQTANVYITFLTFSEFLISFFLDHESHYFTFWWFRLKNRRMRTYIKSFLIDLTREWQRGEGTGSNQKMVEGYWVWKRNLGWHRKGNSRKIRRNQKGGHLTELMSGGRRGGGSSTRNGLMKNIWVGRWWGRYDGVIGCGTWHRIWKEEISLHEPGFEMIHLKWRCIMKWNCVSGW